MPQPQQPLNVYYPPTGFYFKVAFIGIFGQQEGNFQEVSGITVSITPEEVKEGGENRFTRRLPSPPKYGNLVLKRGMLIGSPLIDWVLNSIATFSFTPKTIVVMLLDENATPIGKWQFYNAYPVKLDVSGLKAMKEGEIVIETMEMAYDFFEKVI
jgi:phage tail-like protein